MFEDEIEVLGEAMARRLAKTPEMFHRSLYGNIAWEDRLLCIKGARGVGKTTLLFQHMKDSFRKSTAAFYVSLDNLFFAHHSLRDVADWHSKNGGVEVGFGNKIPLWLFGFLY